MNLNKLFGSRGIKAAFLTVQHNDTMIHRYTDTLIQFKFKKKSRHKK